MPSTRGRPISQETKLGRKILQSGTKGYLIAAAAGFSARMLTEYVSGRREPSEEHLLALCRVLQCEPWEITEDNDDDDFYMEELSDSDHTLPTPTNLRTVDDLKKNHPTLHRKV